MNRTLIAALGLALLLSSHSAARLIVPNVPDLTLKLTTTFNGSNEFSQSIVHHFKGAWQRHQYVINGQPAPVLAIERCDERRTLHLNAERRLYGYSPMSDAQTIFVLGPERSRGMRDPATAPQPVTTTTMDVRDTGSRRRVGAYTARHVITTESARSVFSGQEYESVREHDGWYIDVPIGSVEPAEREETQLAMQNSGVRMVRTGSGRRGFAVEEMTRTSPEPWPLVDRSRDASGLVPRASMVLESISEETLDPVLFTVPPGYQPALERPWFGVDMMRADTVFNRVSAYWESAVWWVSTAVRSWSY
jgi:hypothetical protein